MMLEQCAATSCQQLNLWSEDTHASHLATLESAEGMMTSGTSGRKCSDLSESSRLLGLLEKMLRATLPSDSMKSLMTWRERATPRGRLYFQLVPSVRRIRESGYSLWPTPRAQDSYERSNKATVIRAHKGEAQMTLARYVRGPDGTCGPLNPDLSRWLMGFAEGWTDLERMETP